MPLLFCLPVIVGMGMISIALDALFMASGATTDDPTSATIDRTSIIRFPARGYSLVKKRVPLTVTR